MYQKHLKPTPTYQELQKMEWLPSVWATYRRFLDEEEDLDIARRYLELQYKLNSEPRNERLATMAGNRLDKQVIKAVILSLLHPYQIPLTIEALQGVLAYLGVKIGYEALHRFGNELSGVTGKEPCLQRFANPYRGRQFVYCSAEFQVYPQLGDKVVELLRQRSRRFGVVVDFKLYRLNGKRYPVIQTETSRSFVDPERIIIVERLGPFEKHQPRKSKQQAHTSAYTP